MAGPDSKAGPVEHGDWVDWTAFGDPDDGSYLAAIAPSFARAEGVGRATVAFETRSGHRNRLGFLHGGFLATAIDHAGFAALNVLGRPEQLGGVTIDLAVQYFGAGRVGPPLMIAVEILKETGRLFFLRLTATQNGDAIAAGSLTLRKVSEPK